MSPTAQLIRAANRLIARAVAAGAQAYGRDPLHDDIHLLRRATGIRPRVVGGMEYVSMITPEVRGVRELVLRDGLSPSMRRFVELYEHGRHFGGVAEDGEDAAVIFALRGVLSVRECLARPSSWERGVLEEIAALYPAWGDTILPGLAAVSKRVTFPGSAVSPVAATVPSSAARDAWSEARLRRLDGDLADAADGYQMACTIAQRAGDWEILVRSWIGRAKIAHELADFRTARRHLGYARTLATTHGLVDLAGEAVHHLVLIASDMGQDARASALIAEAVDLFPTDPAGLGRLALDVARHWVQLGDHEAALPILLEMLHHVPDHRECVVAWGNVAYAAGGIRHVALFARASGEVRHLCEGLHSPQSATAQLAVGWGAALLGEGDVAVEMVVRAMADAVICNARVVTAEASALQHMLDGGRGGPLSRRRVARARAEAHAALATNVVRVLRARVAQAA
ncbi:MAG: hypothetical protein JWM27_4746 [Gemmatimonadetes bacterium]|nr:hypothetical protein [Gemmatimonadota bacterium]